ncbi:MAG: ribonuclease P protein component [Candidatus Algichlamydia australiensis]|nr:ribonuclease P protein component [Chlamydiales bacterium]
MKFPKSLRLLKSSDFSRVHKRGYKFVGEKIILHYRLGPSDFPKLGLTVSRKFGKANLRNRFKRLVREAFREKQQDLPPGLEVNIRPKFPNVDLSLALIKKEFDTLAQHVKRAAK